MFVFGRRVVPIVLLSAGTLISTPTPARAQVSDAPTFRAVDLGLPDGDKVEIKALNRHGQIAAMTTSTESGTSACWLYSNGNWTSLGSLGGPQCQPNAMNDSGQVVGFSTTAAGLIRPFIYSDGHMHDLGVLSGVIIDSGIAWDINSSGAVVGQYRSGGPARAFLYQGGALRALDAQAQSGAAFGINDAGQVVGVRQLGTSQTAYRYQNGTFEDISAAGAESSVGRLINEAGDVAGTFIVRFEEQDVTGALILRSEQHAFAFTAGVVRDLGTFVGTLTIPSAMNDHAQIVGAANVSDNTQHAVLARDGVVIDLGSLGVPPNDSSVARSINRLGHIVGQTATLDGTATGFFSSGDGLLDLRQLLTPDSLAQITDAQWINDVGQIAAIGEVDGRPHVFLLSPPAAATELVVTPVTVRYGTRPQLSATLTSGAMPLAQKTVTFAIDGVSVGSAITDQTGVAQLTVAGQTTTGDHSVVAAFDGDPEYLASTGSAVLNVMKAHARLVVAGGTFTYDGQSHGATVTATGALGETLTEGLSVLYNGSPDAPVAAGTYSATVAFSGDDNYEPQTASAGITVLKAPLTVTAGNAKKLLGAPNPVFTASYSGFVAGESAALLSGTLTFSTAATLTSPVGTYPITPSGLSSPNYDIHYANGTLTVTYRICVRFDQTRAVRAGSTIPIKLDLCNASGIAFSSSSVVLNTETLTKISGAASSEVQDAGDANPDFDFRYVGPGYIFNLKTTGLTTGTWDLMFKVTGDPLTHDVTFQVR